MSFDYPKVVTRIVKKFLPALKAALAVLLSFVFVAGSATVLNSVESAQAAASPFTCTSNFYQVSNGDMYQYSVTNNAYTKMAQSTTVANVNAAGYNTADNYIYAITSTGNGAGQTTTLYKYASDGSHVSLGVLAGGGASIASGDFIAPDRLLTVNGTGHTPLGTFTLIDTSTSSADPNRLSVSAFTSTGATWAADDFAFNASNNTIYGMDGTTLYIGTISGTNVSVSTKAVVNSGASGATDPWGATYIDSSSNAYFFDNTNFNLVEISAASLASGAPSALNITQANLLKTPNDGASCPTATSPLAPTVTTTPATSVTTTTAILNGTVTTGIPASSNILSGDLIMCRSTSPTVVDGALSVATTCASVDPTPSNAVPAKTASTTEFLPASGLIPGTTYYYQLHATNAYGLLGLSNVSSFTTVAANHTVTFDNNGGSGTMSDEVNNAATPLTGNTFTRAGYTFAGWNTAANGSGTSYANLASYPFTADGTMFAQWTAIPTHTVTFDNNGGTGTMGNEVNNVAAALTSNTFARAGFTFAGWNTIANGSGIAYANAASYPFTADATMFAQWTAIPTKTVTFDPNNGTGTMANEVKNVPTALTGNTFTRAGYTFAGWNTAANGTGTPYANLASYPFTADGTMFAQWTAIPTHTVTFDNNGGTGTISNEVNNVAAALTSNTFTRAGFTFGGWNTAANGTGTTYANAASYPFTADATMFAQWIAIPNKTVVFDNNGGTGTMSNEVNNVAAPLTSNTFTRAGYTFAGWNTAANGTGTTYANAASYPFTADTTMFAQWTALPTHTVIFDNNGGTGTISNEVNNVAAALTSNTFTRAGFTFAGWNTIANGSGIAYANSASYPFTADATMFAQWTAIPTKTVTFDSNGGIGTIADEVNNIPTALTGNTFTRAGYTFAGWNTAASGTGIAYANAASYPFTADATMFAQWTAIPTKTVTFDSNGGSGTIADEVNNVPTALTGNTFTRAGYAFAGWNTLADGSGVDYANLASYPFTADGTMFAQWTAIPTHTVTFDNNGGTGTISNEVNNVAAPLTSNTFTRAGYNFAGWNTADDGSGTDYANLASYPFTANATMYAKWTSISSKTVTFDNNGGTGTIADEVNNVAAPLTANTFTRPGYTFAGWNTLADGSGIDYANLESYPFTADGTMFAQWTALPTHTVGFDNNGGTGTIADEVNNVAAPLTANTFTRPGYTFAGWNTLADGSGIDYANLESYPFTADETMFAQWTPIATKTVTFAANGGTGTMADEVKNVPTALSPNGFTRAGYTFAGWVATPGSATYTDGGTYSFTADATMTAQWTAIATHTVTFDPNNGTGTIADEVDNVATPLTGNTFTRAGYTFAGWNTAANGSGNTYANLASYPFTADATMFAQWTAIPDKTVTFDPNNGTGTIADEVENLPTALTGNTFTRAGFKFAGWNTAADGSGIAYANLASYPFTADATMFAQWTPIPILTFDMNGGGGAIGSVSSDVPTNLPTTTVNRPGYTFTGWNTAKDGSGTAYAPGAIYPFLTSGTLFAQFTKILASTGVDPTPGLTLGMLLLALGLALVAAVAFVTRRRSDRATS